MGPHGEGQLGPIDQFAGQANLHVALALSPRYSPAGGSLPRPLLLLATLTVASGACTRPERAETALQVQRDTVGDTVFVRTIAGSLWRGQARLEEELSIGAREGADEYMFGEVTAITPDGAGGFYVFDRQVPALRHFDHGGRFIKTLGGEGEGPGEYKSIVGMALRRDGRLTVFDAENHRIVLYEVDGTPSEHWRINSSLYVGQALLVDSMDQTYVKILTEWGQPLRWPWPIGLLHIDARGRVVDTMRPPRIEGEPQAPWGPLSPEKVWALDPYATVVGVNDRYAFEIRKPNGQDVRVSRQYRPLPVSGDEWRAYEARRAWKNKHEEPSEPPPTTPRTKPAYRAFTVAQDGRIWVRRYMPVSPLEVKPSSDPNAPPPFPFTEQVGFDVFDADGVYLGEVLVPPKTDIYWIGTDELYGVRRGDLDEEYVVRLRLRIPR